MLRVRTPPGPQGRPYTGDPLRFLTQCARDYGDVVRLQSPAGPLYLLSHPDDIDYVQRSNDRNFKRRVGLSGATSGLLGQGLLTGERGDDFWRRQRQLAHPVFQPQQVQSYAPVVVAYTRRMLETWHAGETRDLLQDLLRLTLEIVGKALFGVDLDDAIRELSPALTFGNPYFPSAVHRLDQALSGLVRERRVRGTEGDDLLSRLLKVRDEQGGWMTDRQFREAFITLFLTGRETTALALSYSFDLIARHPDVEARLGDELDLVLGNRAPTAADAPRLRYTEWLIKESMRLYPPVWRLRSEVVDDCEIGGYPFAKGTLLLLCQWVVHRDPRWFEDPEAFQPQRWDNELDGRLPLGAYFPFGHGPRVCIGNHFAILAMVLILATIAQRYRLTPVPGSSLQVVPSILLQPLSGIKMVVGSRVDSRAHGRGREFLEKKPTLGTTASLRYQDSQPARRKS